MESESKTMNALITNVSSCPYDIDEIISIHLVEFDWKVSAHFGLVLRLFEEAKLNKNYDSTQKIDLIIESEPGKFDDAIGHFELVVTWDNKGRDAYRLCNSAPTHILFTYADGSCQVSKKISEVVMA